MGYRSMQSGLFNMKLILQDSKMSPQWDIYWWKHVHNIFIISKSSSMTFTSNIIVINCYCTFKIMFINLYICGNVLHGNVKRLQYFENNINKVPLTHRHFAI